MWPTHPFLPPARWTDDMAVAVEQLVALRRELRTGGHYVQAIRAQARVLLLLLESESVRWHEVSEAHAALTDLLSDCQAIAPDRRVCEQPKPRSGYVDGWRDPRGEHKYRAPTSDYAKRRLAEIERGGK